MPAAPASPSSRGGPDGPFGPEGLRRRRIARGDRAVAAELGPGRISAIDESAMTGCSARSVRSSGSCGVRMPGSSRSAICSNEPRPSSPWRPRPEFADLCATASRRMARPSPPGSVWRRTIGFAPIPSAAVAADEATARGVDGRRCLWIAAILHAMSRPCFRLARLGVRRLPTLPCCWMIGAMTAGTDFGFRRPELVLRVEVRSSWVLG
jgi:hypothetical protein